MAFAPSQEGISDDYFSECEGFVVGLLTAANAAGQLVFLPTMASPTTSKPTNVGALHP